MDPFHVFHLSYNTHVAVESVALRDALRALW